MTQPTIRFTGVRNAETYIDLQRWNEQFKAGFQQRLQRQQEQMQNANQKQEGGDHYKSKAIQPWDYIVSNNMGYLEGNIVKYVSRWKEKGGVADLRKAMHYLEKLIETSS